MDSARELLEQLRDRKLFICNARAWLGVDDIIHDFHVEEAFGLYHPDDPSTEFALKKDWITGTDGCRVTINDLYRAAELGMSTVDEICDIRKQYGSLEQFLQINVLDEQKGKKHEN